MFRQANLEHKLDQNSIKASTSSWFCSLYPKISKKTHLTINEIQPNSPKMIGQSLEHLDKFRWLYRAKGQPIG